MNAEKESTEKEESNLKGTDKTTEWLPSNGQKQEPIEIVDSDEDCSTDDEDCSKD